MSSSLLTPEVMAFFSDEIEKLSEVVPKSARRAAKVGLGVGLVGMGTGYAGLQSLKSGKEGYNRAMDYGPLPGQRVQSIF